MENQDDKTLIDVMKSAILMERRGKAFYKKVAEQTEDEEVKKIFNIMAKEEDIHIRFLSEQFIHLVNYKEFKLSNFKENSGEGSIADIILSKDLKKKISASGYEAAAISAAIDMENKAIDIYSDRARTTTNSAERSLFEWLANWEKGHLNILNDLNNELMEHVWNDNKFWPF